MKYTFVLEIYSQVGQHLIYSEQPVLAPRLNQLPHCVCVHKCIVGKSTRQNYGSIRFPSDICSEMIEFPVTLRHTEEEFGYRLLTNEKGLMEIQVSINNSK